MESLCNTSLADTRAQTSFNMYRNDANSIFNNGKVRTKATHTRTKRNEKICVTYPLDVFLLLWCHKETGIADITNSLEVGANERKSSNR